MSLNLHTNSNFILSIVTDFLNFLKRKKENSYNLNINFYLNEVEYIDEEYFNMFHKDILSFCNKMVGIIVDPLKNIIRGDLISSYNLPTDVIFDRVFIKPLILLLRYYRLYFVHAACVAKDKKGILIPGRFGSGKSSIAISLARDGFLFLSDEFPLLRKRDSKIEALAFPLKLGLRNTSLGLFPELNFLMGESTKTEQKQRFFIEEAYPNCVINQCEPQLLLFPQFRKSGQIEVRPLSKREALMCLIDDPDTFALLNQDSHQISQQHFKFLSFLVEQTKAYQLFYNNNDIHRIPQLINNLLSLSTFS